MANIENDQVDDYDFDDMLLDNNEEEETEDLEEDEEAEETEDLEEDDIFLDNEEEEDEEAVSVVQHEASEEPSINFNDMEAVKREIQRTHPVIYAAFKPFQRKMQSFLKRGVAPDSDDSFVVFTTYCAYNARRSNICTCDACSESFYAMLASLNKDTTHVRAEECLGKCAIFNLNGMLDEFEENDELICQNCKKTLNLAEFNGASTLVHSCGKLIDTLGNVIQTTEATCPSCGGKYKVTESGSKYCEDCDHRIKGAKGFEIKVRDRDAALAQVINNECESTVNVLMRLYTNYWRSLDPPVGLLSYRYKNVAGKNEVVHASNSIAKTQCIGMSKNHLYVPASSEATNIIDALWCSVYGNNLFGETDNPAALGSYGDYALNLAKSATKRPESFLDSPSMHSGFHIPHIYKFYRKEGTFVAIDDSNPDSVAEFEKFLHTVLHAEWWEVFYTLRNVTLLDTTLMKALGFSGDTANRRVALSIVNAINIKLRQKIKAFIVFKQCDSTIFDIDIVVEPQSKALAIIADFNKAINNTPGKIDTAYANALFGATDRQAQCLHSGKVPGDLTEHIANILVVLRPTEYLALPMFAYKPVQKLKKLGLLSDKKILLGQTFTGEYSYIKDIFSTNGVLEFAGSRAGKGVITLAMLGRLLPSGLPIAYLDAKPDMAGVMLNLANDLTKEVKQIDPNHKPIKFLSFEFLKLYHANKDNSWYVPFSAESKEQVKRDQSNARIFLTYHYK